MEELIGKKIFGFKFEHEKTDIFYGQSMDNLIGKSATILYKDDDGYGYAVKFDDDPHNIEWNYPYPELLDHLVEEERSIEEIIIKMKELILKI
jgi:hypothetical protein